MGRGFTSHAYSVLLTSVTRTNNVCGTLVDRREPVTAFRLSASQREYADRVRSVATQQLLPLAGRSGSAVNRPMLKELGRLG